MVLMQPPKVVLPENVRPRRPEEVSGFKPGHHYHSWNPDHCSFRRGEEARETERYYPHECSRWQRWCSFSETSLCHVVMIFFVTIAVSKIHHLLQSPLFAKLRCIALGTTPITHLLGSTSFVNYGTCLLILRVSRVAPLRC